MQLLVQSFKRHDVAQQDQCPRLELQVCGGCQPHHFKAASFPTLLVFLTHVKGGLETTVLDQKNSFQATF